jgi:hypothetical protein
MRHASVSLWLNGGVPATEVTRRAGHSVAVLLKVYANCIDGEEESVNDRIERASTASRARVVTFVRTQMRVRRLSRPSVGSMLMRVHSDVAAGGVSERLFEVRHPGTGA